MSISIETMKNCLLGLLLLILGLAYDRYRIGIARRMVETWALQNRFHVTTLKRCFYFNDPSFLMRSNVQFVFKISVEDEEGKVRTGWIRCGHWFLGLVRDQVTIFWDERLIGEKATVRQVRTGMWDHDLDG
jgi:hypothetical protein